MDRAEAGRGVDTRLSFADAREASHFPSGAGAWPGGSEGPHKLDDVTSWDESKRLRMHLNRAHRMDPVTYPESLAKLRDLHDQLHDGAYPYHSPEERDGHGHRNHHRTDLT
jgi:hypothetical protein